MQRVRDLTFYIPENWREAIEGSEILPLDFSGPIYLSWDWEEDTLFGWDISFRTGDDEPSLEVWLIEPGVEYGEEEYLVSFLLDDIDRSTWKDPVKFADDEVRIRCAWMRKKKLQVQKHPGVKSLAPYLGSTKSPETFEDKLIEYIDGTLMFDGYPGFQEGVFIVIKILEEHNVDPLSDQGKKILQVYIDHALDELYGDFYRFAKCVRCCKEFRPTYTIDYINHILNDTIRCPECQASETE